jgi:AcrR family transcriptional regulator
MSPHAADRRTQLLTAAAACFARRGVAAATVDEIVTAAGVTPVILYRHFGNKDGLVHALVEEWATDRLQRGADALAAPSSAAALEAWLALLIDPHPASWTRVRDDARLSLAIIDAAARDRALATRLRRADDAMREQLERAIARAQTDGHVTTRLDADATAELLIALADGLVVRAALMTRRDAPRITQLAHEFRVLADQALHRMPIPDSP